MRENFFCKLRKILAQREITLTQFCADTGIARSTLVRYNRHSKALLMACAYYLDMRVEDLIDGTDAEDRFYS